MTYCTTTYLFAQFIRRSTDLRDYCNKQTWYEDEWTVQRRYKDAYLDSYMNSNDAIKKVFPQHCPRPLMAHVSAVVRHDTLRFIYAEMFEEVKKSMTRFRGEQILHFPYMLANVEQDKGKVNHKIYFSVLEFVCSLSAPEEVRRGLLKAYKNSKTFLCVNDDIQDPQPVHGELIHAFFEALVGNDVAKNVEILEGGGNNTNSTGQ